MLYQVIDLNGNLLATYPMIQFAKNHFGTWGLQFMEDKDGGAIYIRGKMKGTVVAVSLIVS